MRPLNWNEKGEWIPIPNWETLKAEVVKAGRTVGVDKMLSAAKQFLADRAVSSAMKLGPMGREEFIIFLRNLKLP